MLRKRIAIIDFDGTISGTPASRGTSHRLNHLLLTFLAKQGLDGVYIATARRFHNTTIKEKYADRVFDYAKPDDLQKKADEIPITIRSGDKESKGELGWLKSGLMVHAIQELSTLTGLSVHGVSMAQDITHVTSKGLGHIFENYVKPFEDHVLAAIARGESSVTLLPEEKLVTNPEHLDKNKQIEQIIASIRKDFSGRLEVIFIDDKFALCQAAETQFTDASLYSPDKFSFQAFCAFPNQIVSVVDYHKLRREKLEKDKAARALRPVTIKEESEFILQLKTTDSEGGYFNAQCFEEKSLFANFKYIKDTRRSSGFFSKATVKITLSGMANKVKIEESFESVAAFEKYINDEFAFSMRKSELPISEHIHLWQEQLKSVRMSDAKRHFLFTMLALIENYNVDQIVPANDKAFTIDSIRDILMNALIPGDDEFFDFARLMMHSQNNLLTSELRRSIISLIDKSKNELIVWRNQVQGILIGLAMLGCCADPRICIPIAMLLVGHYMNVYSLEKKCNDTIERYETRQGMRM